MGIQNADKTDGLTVVHNDGSYLHEDLAIKFSSATAWLSVSPAAGSTAAQSATAVNVLFDAFGLAAVWLVIALFIGRRYLLLSND